MRRGEAISSNTVAALAPGKLALLCTGISQNRVRLLHGTRYELREVAVPRLPSDLHRALHYDQREGSYQTHSGQPQIRGKEGLVFTGQGGEVDVAKAEIASFFKMIDAAVNDFLHSQTDPLLFAGVDYLFPIYRQHNHYPRLLPTHISGNPDLLSADDLRPPRLAAHRTSASAAARSRGRKVLESCDTRPGLKSRRGNCFGGPCRSGGNVVHFSDRPSTRNF